MSKIFIKALFLTMLTVIILTACGTSSPATTSPAYPAPATAASAYPAPDSNSPTAAPAGTVSFATDIMPILQSRCVSCHGGNRTEKGLDLKTYDSLMAGSSNGAVIVAGDAGHSTLASMISSGKMPKRGPKLTPSEVQLFIDWINAGALNN